jgi:quinoprotein glucose dehydrogenase
MMDCALWVSTRAALGLYLLIAAAAVVARPAPTPTSESSAGSRQPTLENASQRSALPLYRTIPAATDSELTPAALSRDPASDRSWSRSNADAANTRYSILSQINRVNVSELKVAWSYHSGDGNGNIEANPVIAGGVIFTPTVGKNIVAINGETGAEIWRFHPLLPSSGTSSSQEPHDGGFGPAQRGLTYWDGDSEHRPRLFFMANGYLIALDPKSGTVVDTFGEHGKVASSKGAGASSFLGAVPPTIYRNVILAANQNLVDAFDVVTGKHVWQFNTLRYPVGDPGEDNGGNVWGGMALDVARGIAFIATGDPHPNFVGIERQGSNTGTCSLIALDALTGRVLWSFQEIAHNLWDLDIPAPPNLVTVSHHGKPVDAVAQVTKLGNTLLLDRVTGKPLFPYRLRRAPVSRIPGERTAPYQPDLELPEPFARQVFSLEDVTDLNPESHTFIMNRVKKANFGWFEPLGEDEPTIFYGIHGGAEWPGASFDPSTGWLYVTANEIPWIESLSRSAVDPQHDAHQPLSPGEAVYRQHCAGCHGTNRRGQGMVPSLIGVGDRLSEGTIAGILKNGGNAMPPITLSDDEQRKLFSFLFAREALEGKASAVADNGGHTTYVSSGFDKLLDANGYPGSKPPWGTLNAIDLNTGKLVWKVPLGEYEELTRLGIPKTGTENFGGAMATGGGLVFGAGTRDLNIRAFDKTNGDELWHYKLPYGGFAPPATYEINGRQYVVIASTGGGKLGGELGDAYVAFALPR